MAECLPDLIAALGTATGPSREMDVMLAGLVFYRQPQPIEAPVMCENAMQAIGTSPGTDEPWSANDIAIALEHPRAVKVPAYTSSLDAITRAVEQRWPPPDWAYSLDTENMGVVIWNRNTQQSEARAWGGSKALALCLAAARLALAEQVPA